uniref:Macro domain-containing protein n=1 Tax=Strigamia maritima TaxID=126957 RepID=T1JKQ9_STRMM
MDPLGVVSEVIDINTLKRWNDIAHAEFGTKENGKTRLKKNPFPFDENINKKVVLWFGELESLNAHAIVHSTNETFSDKNAISDEIFRKAGSKMQEELVQDIRVCKTGEVKLTKGYDLPARYVIHTVGPKYNAKYVTAAQGALYSCYRKSLELAKENKLQSIAFSVINSRRRGYPSKDAAHIALRTVRRFLEKFTNAFDAIIFVVKDNDIGIYEQLMPLYFPRSQSEERFVLPRLPDDIGNQDGEPVNPDRQIRIIDNPHHKIGIDESTDLLEPSNIGKTEFAKMTVDVDQSRVRAASVQEEMLTLELQRQHKYERLLRRSRTEDLSEISGIGCLYQSGCDRLGRPVIVFVGKWFKFNEINLDKALLYLVYLLDSVVKQDYIIVYFHTLTTSENHSSMAWIRDVYNSLEYKYKKNLKAFYIVHPTFWTKLMCWWFTTFMAPAIKHKVQSLGGIEYLYGIMDANQLEIPCFITEHDMTVNGIRYYAPPPPSLDDL